MQKLGFRFDSKLSLDAMCERINAATSRSWSEGDSDRYEYIAGDVAEGSTGRIYVTDEGFLAELRITGDHGAAVDVLLGRILPAISAEAVHRASPMD